MNVQRPEDNLGCCPSSAAYSLFPPTYVFVYLFLDSVRSLLDWNLPTRPEWWEGEPQGCSCLRLPRTGIPSMCGRAQHFDMCSGESNLGSCAHKAGTSPTELSRKLSSYNLPLIPPVLLSLIFLFSVSLPQRGVPLGMSFQQLLLSRHLFYPSDFYLLVNILFPCFALVPFQTYLVAFRSLCACLIPNIKKTIHSICILEAVPWSPLLDCLCHLLCVISIICELGPRGNFEIFKCAPIESLNICLNTI